MRASDIRIWLSALLLLAAANVWAEDYQVTVGGTSGGEYGGGAVLMFSPSDLTIEVGDTVTFTNAGGFHNATADDGSFRCANGCDNTGGNGAPSSNNWSATVAFTEAGDVPYHCEIHGSMGMTGMIHVLASTGGGSENVPITAGFTGAWYDPAQSGHGIFLEVLPDDQLVAWWFAFNPEGTQQAWFGGVGTISNDVGTVDLTIPTGGRWIPNFDPNAVVRNPWGRLTFTFTDCNHGNVDFDATQSGYGTGSMVLERVTQPAGVTCP